MAGSVGLAGSREAGGAGADNTGEFTPQLLSPVSTEGATSNNELQITTLSHSFIWSGGGGALSAPPGPSWAQWLSHQSLSALETLSPLLTASHQSAGTDIDQMTSDSQAEIILQLLIWTQTFLNNIPSQLELLLEIIFYLHKEYQFSGLFWIWQKFNIWIFLWLACVLCLYIFLVEHSNFSLTTFYTQNSDDTFCKCSHNFYRFSYLNTFVLNEWSIFSSTSLHFLDTFQPKSWRIFINKGVLSCQNLNEIGKHISYTHYLSTRVLPRINILHWIFKDQPDLVFEWIFLLIINGNLNPGTIFLKYKHIISIFYFTSTLIPLSCMLIWGMVAVPRSGDDDV